MPDLPQVVFAVPRGFEDVAAEDILRFLPVQRDCVAVSSIVDTGHVRLRFLSLADLAACLQIYDSGKLWAVTRCMLSIGEPIQVSEDLFQRLQEERKALPSKRSRIIVDPNSSKPRLSKRRKNLAPLDATTTPGELELLDQLIEAVKSAEEQFQGVFEIWKSFRYGSKTVESAPESFAVRAERREFLFPTLKSSKVAEVVGSEMADALCRYNNKERQRVDLTNPDLEILVDFVNERDAPHLESWSIHCGVLLLSPRHLSPHRLANRIFGRTSLLPQRAYCLCLLHPVLAPQSPQRGHQGVASLFLDPCSGHGSVPTEIAAMSIRDGLQITALAADNEVPSVENASHNYTAAGLASKAGLGGIGCGIIWDGRGKGRSGGFRAGVVDGIVSDLPWGVRELSAQAINALYPSLLRTLGEATADGAYAVFLSGKKKSFDFALQLNASQWELYSERVVNVEGIMAHAFVLRRRERPQA